MRLVVLVVLLGWLAQISGASPLRFHWSNPLPFGANISDLAYGSGLTVAVGERGQIYTSEDLDFWEPRRSGTERALRSVLFYGARLVISGEAGTVLFADSLDHFEPLDLNTDDWLEALAASTNLLVAAGDNGAIYTSSDGQSWKRQSTPFTTWLRGAAYGAGGFVVVGETGFIATSSDGTNWMPQTSGTSAHLNRVVWTDNSFYATVDNGRLLKSVDGISWSTVLTGASGPLYDMECLGANCVAVGQNEVRRQPAHTLWLNELLLNTNLPSWTYTSVVGEDTVFLVGGRSGMLAEGFGSAPNFVWLQRTRSIRNWLWECARWPDFYVAVGNNGTILTSGNGIDWDLELTPFSEANTVFLGVGGTTNLLLATGSDGAVVLSPQMFTDIVSTNLSGSLVTNLASTLGVFWHALLPHPTTEDLQGVAVFGSLFILTGGQGTILTSPNGTNWTPRLTGTTAFLSGIAPFPGGVVATGDAGTILTSTDGLAWTPRPMGLTNWIYRVRYVNGQLIAVGEEGIILTSPDGNDWVRQNSGTTAWLNDVIFTEDAFYIVGTQGTLLTSTNALDWSSITTLTGKALYGAAAFDGQLILCGVEGAILRTQLRPLLQPARFEQFTRQDGYHVYLISGQPDQRWTLEQSEDLTEWSSGPSFEFLDSSGTVLLLQKRPLSEPGQEFYRTRLNED